MAVEVNGIYFETFMPERLLFIPAIRSGVRTPVQLGIRITNNTSNRLRFSFFSGLNIMPELVTPDGQILKAGYATDRLVVPVEESDFVLALPGKAVTLLPDTFLYWLRNPKKKRDRKLRLTLSVRNNDILAFQSLTPGNYQIRFNYVKSVDAVKEYGRNRIDPGILQEVWTGQVVTPLVEFRLVDVQIE